jgi:hypothetical protein
MYDAPLPLSEPDVPRGTRFVLCMLANLVLVSLGLTGLLLLANMLRSMMSVMLAVVVVAGLTSAVQRRLWLEGYPSLSRWVTMSVLAWGSGLIATVLFSMGEGPTGILLKLPLVGFDVTVIEPPPWWYLAGTLLGGLIAGVFQTVSVHAYVPGKLWWIPLTIVGWGLGLYLIPDILATLNILACCF